MVLQTFALTFAPTHNLHVSDSVPAENPAPPLETARCLLTTVVLYLTFFSSTTQTLTDALHEPGICAFYDECARNPLVEGSLLPPMVPCVDYKPARLVIGEDYKKLKTVCVSCELHTSVQSRQRTSFLGGMFWQNPNFWSDVEDDFSNFDVSSCFSSKYKV